MQYNYIANVLGYDYLNTEYMQTLRTIYPSKKDRFLVRTSYMEIYNERLLDLMVYTSVCDCVTIHTIVLIQLFSTCMCTNGCFLEFISILQCVRVQYDYQLVV